IVSYNILFEDKRMGNLTTCQYVLALLTKYGKNRRGAIEPESCQTADCLDGRQKFKRHRNSGRLSFTPGFKSQYVLNVPQHEDIEKRSYKDIMADIKTIYHKRQGTNGKRHRLTTA